MRLRILIWNAIGLPPHISCSHDAPRSPATEPRRSGSVLFLWTLLFLVGLAAVLVVTFFRTAGPAR